MRVGAVSAVVLVAAFVGCGGGGSARAAQTQESAPSAIPSTPSVAKPAPLVIKDFRYAPGKLKVKRGQLITVVNKDSSVHTVTGKAFDSKNLKKGQKYTFKLNKRGTYDYICDVHQYMTGKIVVS